MDKSSEEIPVLISGTGNDSPVELKDMPGKFEDIEEEPDDELPPTLINGTDLYCITDGNGEKSKETIEESVSKAMAENVEKKKKKVGRNEKCPCGSGKKYKKCCIDKD